MNDSSDDEEPFQLRDDDEDSDEERPNKRRKTMRPLRGRGLGFVQSSATDEADQDEEDDVDDERPAMGGFRNSFNIGEYTADTERRIPAADMPDSRPPQESAGSGPSAFGQGGRIQKTSFAARMMAKQGYVEGQGLGRAGQGITAPIQAQVLKSRAGLGVGGTTSEQPRKQGKDKAKGKGSQTSTPGTTTPRLKAPPKTKYTVTAIESRGLHIPEAMKSIIVDATGAEAKMVTSLSGFSTPTRDVSPDIEASKATSRLRLQLQAYADAWDATKAQETHLDSESVQLQAAHTLHVEEVGQHQDMVFDFEKIALEDASIVSNFDQVVLRLHEIQDKYADYIEDLDLPELAVACLEGSFRKEMTEWEDPLIDPKQEMVNSLQTIGALLEFEKSTESKYRKRTTPFESLLLIHWFPRIRSILKSSWNVYESDKAVSLINTWSSLLPLWLLYKILNELILPRLIEAVRRFPKEIHPSNHHYKVADQTTSHKKHKAPDLHSWLFEWWTLLSEESLDLELFPELKHHIKLKVDSSSWSNWKPLLGSTTTRRVKPNISTPSQPPSSTTKAITNVANEMTFKDLVEEWCSENNLIIHSSHKSDSFGRLLYKIQDAEKKSRGILIYLQDDVVFTGEDSEPFALDQKLVDRVLNKS